MISEILGKNPFKNEIKVKIFSSQQEINNYPKATLNSLITSSGILKVKKQNQGFSSYSLPSASQGRTLEWMHSHQVIESQ